MPVFSYGYSAPYLLFLLYLVVLMFFEFRRLNFEKDINHVRWGVIGGFLIFFGFRGFVFTDWTVYYPLFEKIPTIWDGGILNVLDPEISQGYVTDASTGKAGIEIGFLYFTMVFKSIIPDYHAWLFFNSLLDVLLLDFIFKKYSKYYVLSFILFFAFGGLIIECNLMRNVKAILLFLISLKYLEERRIIPYMLINGLGFLFHTSAIFYIPLYFILHKKWPNWLLWTIFILGNLIFLLHISFLKPIMVGIGDMIGGRLGVQIRLYFVLDLYNKAVSIGYEYLEQIITFALLILFKKKMLEDDKRNVLFINAYFIYFIIYLFGGEIIVIIERLTLLVIFSYWFIYPAILHTLKDTVNKWIMVIALVGYCGMKLILMNCNVFSRYDNLLFGIETYESRNQKIYNDFDNVLMGAPEK